MKNGDCDRLVMMNLGMRSGYVEDSKVLSMSGNGFNGDRYEKEEEEEEEEKDNFGKGGEGGGGNGEKWAFL